MNKYSDLIAFAKKKNAVDKKEPKAKKPKLLSVPKELSEKWQASRDRGLSIAEVARLHNASESTVNRHTRQRIEFLSPYALKNAIISYSKTASRVQVIRQCNEITGVYIPVHELKKLGIEHLITPGEQK